MAVLSSRCAAFFAFLLRSFVEDRCQRSAAALSYTTLLSLVPLTAVAFSVLAAFPVFQGFAAEIQDFIFKNFVPASGEVVRSHLEEFAAKASRLTAIGIGFLILSALLMMNTIETALNDIWHVRRSRRALSRFMVYWATLTLGPILVGASLATTSYLISLPLFDEAVLLSGLKSVLLSLLPFLATMLACTLLYAIVPNTAVPLRHAVAGAFVAALLFELAKRGFALYVTTFPTYEVVYGALAAIPVFLVWVYLSWLVILLGAELTFCLARFSLRIPEDEGGDSPVGKVLVDFHLLRKIWRAQEEGVMPTLEMLTEGDPHYDAPALEAGLERLREAGLVHMDCDRRWALSKTPERLTLLDLWRAQGGSFPVAEADGRSSPLPPGAAMLLERLEQSVQCASEAFERSLLELFRVGEECRAEREREGRPAQR